MNPSERKYYPKRALIFSDKAKQRLKRYYKKDSEAYQNWYILKAGLSNSYMWLDITMNKTLIYWRSKYGSQINPRHGRLILLVHDYCAMHSKDNVFSAQEIEDYVRSLMYDQRVDQGHRLMVTNSLLRYLTKYHFINPLGLGFYAPTTRMKLFIQYFNEEAKKYFKNFLPDNQ